MAHWLFKTEPSEYGIHDLQREKQTAWNGIRNYQARNHLRDRVRKEDTVWLYHSACKQVGIAGKATVLTSAYADPDQWNPNSPYFDAKSSTESPRWYCVDIGYVETFAKPIPLPTIKQTQELKEMILLKQGRLSIQPVSDTEANILDSLRSL